jgi:hypothetical protein
MLYSITIMFVTNKFVTNMIVQEKGTVDQRGDLLAGGEVRQLCVGGVALGRGGSGDDRAGRAEMPGDLHAALADRAARIVVVLAGNAG